jgi:succinate dehydrogenase / fumarate reductase iron-sulfur subunit
VHTVDFRILRFKPGRIDPPRFQIFPVTVTPMATVLDGLEEIRLSRDPTLVYRHCCHHASCGTCACSINGRPALACTTRIVDLKTDPITLEPLAHLPRLGDLAVDMRAFFEGMDPDWANIRLCEETAVERTPQGVGHLLRLENCIECGCCTAACPLTSRSEGFMGPASLAAVNNEIRNRPAQREKLLEKAADPRGAIMCRRHLACSRVCPSKVYPARHIADLLRGIASNEKDAPDSKGDGS